MCTHNNDDDDDDDDDSGKHDENYCQSSNHANFTINKNWRFFCLQTLPVQYSIHGACAWVIANGDVDAGNSRLEADSQPKLVGLVWESIAAWLNIHQMDLVNSQTDLCHITAT